MLENRRGRGIYIKHPLSRLVHGNLKSSNVTYGSRLGGLSHRLLPCRARQYLQYDETLDSNAFKSTHRATSKSDVYSFGVLLLEFLTGKPPPQHPLLISGNLLTWVRSVSDDDAGEENLLAMLLEIATTCRQTSPEQRSTMWQVLKMLKEFKETMMSSILVLAQKVN
uniref:Protein kinase domain-containing protein n=2 Tax=Nelumbo nucifera TaxID=4432 RepID=A0A822XZZ3_NELNU|nr:TPA_asm: hypothetical protein HUJ06_024431 [Nelumbo nucifera]